MKDKGLGVIGAGGHAKVVIETARAAGFVVRVVFDDDPNLWGSTVLGVAVQGPIEAAMESAFGAAVIAIGSNHARCDIASKLELAWAVIVHPSAVVAKSALISGGTVIFANTVIQPDTEIGSHGIVNTAAIVDHDCRLGDFVHVAPGARVAGAVDIGEGSLVGVGAAIRPGIKIGKWATVGVGAAVVGDVPDEAVVVGVPARARHG